MKRRHFLRGTAAASLVLPAARALGQNDAAAKEKVFRWAFPIQETGFDPAQISDLYSNYVVANIFETPLQYDYLARPAVLRPRAAVAMPEISSDFRTFTVRIQPGIYFQDDPAFKGVKRELTAADFLYQVKRVIDPRWKSPYWGPLDSVQVVGVTEARKAATAPGGRFDYDREIEGLRLLDRYTFQVRLLEPSPRFHENMTDARLFAGVAREIVEAYGDDMMAHPVGTGPFRLGAWTRGSRIVLERNPAFRNEFYDAAPAVDDARGQALLARFKGRKLPMLDRVEISIISESQPRWLSFLNGRQDLVAVPLEFINVAVPNGKLAPALVKKNLTYERLIQPDIVITYFNLDDPVVGGYTPEKVALRRAISLGFDGDEFIRRTYQGSMTIGQSQIPPLTTDYDPKLRTEMGVFDRARARALLDLFGYVDRDGDGWRENPDGSPLELVFASESTQINRAINEVWKRQLDALGLRVRFDVGQWPEHLKQARVGKLMIWFLGNTAAGPDADAFLQMGATKGIGSSNFARFRNAEFDKLYDRQVQLPDGPERNAVIDEMKRILVAYMPYKVHGHRYVSDLSQPWLIGFRRHAFARDFFKWIDVDPAQAA